MPPQNWGSLAWVYQSGHTLITLGSGRATVQRDRDRSSLLGHLFAP